MKTNAAMLKELEKTQRRAQDLENEEEARRAETDELRLKLAEVSEKQSGAEENKQSVVELESRLRAISTEKVFVLGVPSICLSDLFLLFFPHVCRMR